MCDLGVWKRCLSTAQDVSDSKAAYSPGNGRGREGSGGVKWRTLPEEIVCFYCFADVNIAARDWIAKRDRKDKWSLPEFVQ